METTNSGVRQGRTLSPLLFSASLTATAREVDASLKEAFGSQKPYSPSMTLSALTILWWSRRRRT
eukprot:15465105-Alexandrium_andersonii.AAC.1